MKTQDAKVTATNTHLSITVTVREGSAFRTSVLRVPLESLSRVDLNLIGQAIDLEVRRRLSEHWLCQDVELPF